MTDTDKFLQVLIEIGRQNKNYIHKPLTALKLHYSSLSLDEIEAFIADLENRNFIEVLHCDDTIQNLIIQPRAIAYLKNQIAADNKAIKDKWEYRLWKSISVLALIVATLSLYISYLTYLKNG